MRYKKLTYAFCDDWLIFAKDEEGNEYMVSCEMWDGWNDLHEDADQEQNAIEKYCLPYALKHWDTISWAKAPKNESDPFPRIPTLGGSILDLFR